LISVAELHDLALVSHLVQVETGGLAVLVDKKYPSAQADIAVAEISLAEAELVTPVVQVA